jgi:hypothetical protein
MRQDEPYCAQGRPPVSFRPDMGVVEAHSTEEEPQLGTVESAPF